MGAGEGRPRVPGKRTDVAIERCRGWGWYHLGGVTVVTVTVVSLGWCWVPLAGLGCALVLVVVACFLVAVVLWCWLGGGARAPRACGGGCGRAGGGAPAAGWITESES